MSKKISEASQTSQLSHISIPLVSGWNARKLLGLPRPKLSSLAKHEAGHVIAALALGIPLQKIAASIIPDGKTLARTLIHHEDMMENSDQVAALEDYAVFLLAGEMADEIRCGYNLDDHMFTSGDGNREKVRRIVELLIPPKLPVWRSYEIELHYLQVLKARAFSLIAGNARAWLQISNLLLKKKTITFKQADDLYLAAKPRAALKSRSSDCA